jgi:hypothetical protein
MKKECIHARHTCIANRLCDEEVFSHQKLFIELHNNPSEVFKAYFAFFIGENGNLYALPIFSYCTVSVNDTHDEKSIRRGDPMNDKRQKNDAIVLVS